MLRRFCREHRGSFAVAAATVMAVLSGSAGLAQEKSREASIGGYYAMRVAGSDNSLPDQVFTQPGIAGV